MKKPWLLAAAALVVAVTVVVTIFRPSEEDRIRKALVTFAEAVRVKPDDTLLSRVGRLKSQLGATVDEGVRVSVPDLDLHVTSREKLVETAAQARLMFQSAECELTDLKIKVDDAATTAKVDATGVVNGTRGGEKRVERRGVHFLLRKDGDWKITTIDVQPATD